MPPPPSARLATWASAVRDSFVVLMPLTFFGVLATLLGHAPFPALQQALVQWLGPAWPASLAALVQASWGMFGLALAVVLSAQLERRRADAGGAAPLPLVWLGLSALVNFMLCVQAGPTPTLQSLGHGAMLLGIAVGTLSGPLLAYFAGWPLLRRLALGYDVDPRLYHATRLTAPLVLSGLVVMVGAQVLQALPAPGTEWLHALPPLLNRWFDADWLLTGAAVLINQLTWFVGIHGGKVLDHQAHALFGAADAAYDPALAWRPLIDTFVHLGGSGATLGLLLALFIVAREGPNRRMAWLSTLPSVFNINELLMFGLPLALNPLFLLPFVLAPLVLASLALVAVHAGLLPLLHDPVPWTTPPLLSGYLLTGSWRGSALQALGLLASTLIYLPFVRRAEAQRVASQARAFALATAAIASQAPPRPGSTQRSDQVGMIARGLLAELRADIGRPALTLAYQPKHDRRGRAVGVEALLRWRHARHGPVSPEVAVALAEESGLIHALGAWVLEEACAHKAQWNALGLGRITMAVNVSPLQLCDAQLPARLAACLARHRLAGGEIELEITESQAIPSGPVVDDNLAQIAALGVSLAMDDFGMGYSSLLHMRRFRVHAIKIDGSLSRDVLSNPITADIIRTITALGRAQHLEVVAEFVETAPQRDRLAELGCDVFQGYLYSAPLSSAACVSYLNRHEEAWQAAAAGRAGAAADRDDQRAAASACAASATSAGPR